MAANGAAIAGATGSSYQIQPADAGAALQCEVTASGIEGVTVALSESALASPISATLPPAVGYVRANAAKPVGETVTCETGHWTGNPSSYEFQWLRNGVPIAGATSGQVSETEFELLTVADAGKAIQCEVTATNADGSVAAVSEGGPSAAALAEPPPKNSSVPTVSGNGNIGEALICGEGEWENSATSYEYQWLRGGVPILGATQIEYTLTPADEGTAIQCQVTAANADGATSAASSQDVVLPSPSTAPPTNIEAPTVRGFPLVAGNKVECRPEEWEEEPTSYEFQNLRNGTAIAGASGRLSASQTEFGETGLTYTLTTADAGKAIQCEVTATNAGGSVTAISGARMVSKALPEASATIPTPRSASLIGSPAGLVLAGKSSEQGLEASGTGWACTIADPTTVTCARSDTLPPGESYPPITLHVHVDREAPVGTPPGGGVTNIATVYGGGASPASASASDPTTIAQVPFGIQSFTTSVTESLDNPFTQAGGHPFAANAKFVFNYIPDDAGKLRTAGGSPKDIETELPPGFLGNPQAAPKCSAAAFAAEGTETPCPIDTAVGYIDFSYETGKLENGQAQPLPSGESSHDALYNLAPAPGHPATFGFIGSKSYAHFTLNALVRSDGDYGITISSPYTATPTLLAASVTFCENGVTQAERGRWLHLRLYAGQRGLDAVLDESQRVFGCRASSPR